MQGFLFYIIEKSFGNSYNMKALLTFYANNRRYTLKLTKLHKYVIISASECQEHYAEAKYPNNSQRRETWWVIFAC